MTLSGRRGKGWQPVDPKGIMIQRADILVALPDISLWNHRAFRQAKASIERKTWRPWFVASRRSRQRFLLFLPYCASLLISLFLHGVVPTAQQQLYRRLRDLWRLQNFRCYFDFRSIPASIWNNFSEFVIPVISQNLSQCLPTNTCCRRSCKDKDKGQSGSAGITQVGCRVRGDSIRWALEDEEAAEVVDAVVVVSVEGAAEVQLKYIVHAFTFRVHYFTLLVSFIDIPIFYTSRRRIHEDFHGS